MKEISSTMKKMVMVSITILMVHVIKDNGKMISDMARAGSKGVGMGSFRASLIMIL